MSNFGDSFSLSRALSSPSYAKTVWCNYNHWKKEGITAEEIEQKYGVSPSDIGQIESQWQGKLASWKSSTALDENQYIIDDDDSSWNEAYNNGKKSAQQTTGYENSAGQKAGQYLNNIGQVGGTVARLAATKVTAEAAGRAAGKAALKKATAKAAQEAAKKTGEELTKEALKDVGDKAVEKISDEALKQAGDEGAKKATEKVTKETAKEAGGKITNFAILIACAFDAASALLYRITRPNKKQHEVVDKLAEDMGNQMSNTVGAQENLAALNDCNSELGDEASVGVEEANNGIIETKTEYDFYKDTLEYLESAKTQGHEFTEEEAELYKTCVQFMVENTEDVAMTQEEATARTTEIYDEMANSQAEYDAQAETVASVEGVTDYAQSVDKTQQVMCYIEGGVQTVSGGLAAFDAWKAGVAAVATGWCGAGAAYGAAALVAGVAAGSDGLAAAEQFKWAKDAGNEIAAREGVQETNEVTLAYYDENVDNYALYMEGVEGLELLEPDDMEAPTDTEVPPVTPAEASQTENLQNKKKEEQA